MEHLLRQKNRTPQQVLTASPRVSFFLSTGNSTIRHEYNVFLRRLQVPALLALLENVHNRFLPMVFSYSVTGRYHAASHKFRDKRLLPRMILKSTHHGPIDPPNCRKPPVPARGCRRSMEQKRS